MPYGSKGHSLSKRLPLRPTILDRWVENNVKTLTVFSTFKYYEQQTPPSSNVGPGIVVILDCFLSNIALRGRGIWIFFENKTKHIYGIFVCK